MFKDVQGAPEVGLAGSHGLPDLVPIPGSAQELLPVPGGHQQWLCHGHCQPSLSCWELVPPAWRSCISSGKGTGLFRALLSPWHLLLPPVGANVPRLI